MRLSRRALLGGGAAGVVAVGGAGLGVERGWLPGRPWLQENLGLNGEDGEVPDVEPGPVERGTFVSRHRLGAEVDWALVRPPGVRGPLPVVVALHGLGGSTDDLLGDVWDLPRFLAAAVADGVPPFALAFADGGTSYWHERPDGEDAAAMVREELLPRAARAGADTSRPGLLGWSMGGYGALRLAAALGPARVPAVVACAPAMWDDPDDASETGFEDAAEYERFTVQGQQDELAGIAVRIDVGTGDAFFRAVQHYVDDFPDDVDLTAGFEPGGHDVGYFRRVLPAQLAFLGRRLEA